MYLELNEIVAYHGKPAGSPLAETSYMRVTTIETNASYFHLVLGTTHASLIDGYYEMKLGLNFPSKTSPNGTLEVFYKKVARPIEATWAVRLISWITVGESVNGVLMRHNKASTVVWAEQLLRIVQGEAVPVIKINVWH